jgi:soluble lytic murein transglycosylase-like protein
VAYAVPRNAPSSDVEIVLPQPLAPSDVAIYQRLLSGGSAAEVSHLADNLADPSLLGPVLAARYLSAPRNVTPAELTAWWTKYSDSPAAPDIFDLMQHKLRRADIPDAPQVTLLPEETLTPSSAAVAVAAPDSAAWHVEFMTGLAAWQRGDLTTASQIFAQTAQMGGISDDDRAASEFWAARAALRMQQPEQYLNWLHQAAWAQDTFYGMLAGRLLGQGFSSGATAPAPLTEADITAVDAIPEGHLAFELMQVGLNDQAALALRALWPQIQADPALARSVMAVATRAGMADISIAIASTLPSPVDEIAGARLPLPALHPRGGFTVDPALIYALARTESGFDANAVSRCGARGLMQLMPVTACVIRRVENVDGEINDPAGNLAIGQAYLHFLARQPGINGNLLAVLASYNAGPNAAAAWYGALTDTSDPLLFLETIPNNETRRFVRQVMADSWLYAEEIGLKPKSLDELAEGDFPPLDTLVASAQ